MIVSWAGVWEEQVTADGPREAARRGAEQARARMAEAPWPTQGAAHGRRKEQRERALAPAGSLRHVSGSRLRCLDSGNAREQETYQVQPSELRGLGLGECYVIHHGDPPGWWITIGWDAFSTRR